MVICEGLAGAPALMLGEHLRARIAAMDGPHHVTVSIGVATAPHEAVDYDHLFAIADERLYQAKAAGRDRVVGVRAMDWTATRPVAHPA